MSGIIREERIGGHRLILGDSLDVMPEIGMVDAVVTSPPYGQQRDYGQKITDWRALVSGCLLQVHPDAQILCNLGLTHRDGHVIRYWDDLIVDMEADAWRLFGWYVWDQGSGLPGDWNGRLAPSHAFVFHFNKLPRKPNKTKPTKGGRVHGNNMSKSHGERLGLSHAGQMIQPWKIPDSVIRCTREQRGGEDAEHPARFPVRFAGEWIDAFTSPGETVLDPFMGSGTTGVACQQFDRKFIGIEIDPDYFDIACRRVDETTRQLDIFIEPESKPDQQGIVL